ncbi:LysM peptidoglycan-binding domain-containing protein [Sphingomonas sp. ST-64]|uniref:LysM peptidoglycan-binding domain-containing protein n=1 Tax=Sphingomonas plantiphila TaxID=3163295 RepID=A0ABW8YNI9_9SPHN
MAVADIRAALDQVRGLGAVTPATPNWGRYATALALAELNVGAGAPGEDSATAWLQWSQSFQAQLWTFRLTGRSIGEEGGAEFALAVTPPGGTAETPISTLFPGLPPSLSSPQDANAQGGGLMVQPSEVGLLKVTSARIVVAVHVAGGGLTARFEARLVIAGSRLERYAAFLGSAPLPLTGTLEFEGRANLPPLLNLTAAATAMLDIAALRIGPVGLLLCTDTIEPDVESGSPSYASTIFLYADATLAGVPDRVRFTAQLLAGDFAWQLEAGFEKTLTVSRALNILSALLPHEQPTGFTLPDGLQPLDQFGLDHLEIDITPPAIGQAPRILRVGGQLVSTSEWDLPVPYVKLKQVGVEFSYVPGLGFPVGTVWGQLQLGEKRGAGDLPSATPVASITTSVAFPDMTLRGELDAPLALPIANYLKLYFPEPIASLGADLKVETLEVAARIPERSFMADAAVSGVWKIDADIVVFSLDRMTFRINADQDGVAGELSAVTTVEPKTEGAGKLALLTSAAYPGDGSWEFDTRLLQPLDLKDMVKTFTGWSRTWFPEARVTDFSAFYSTAPGKPFAVDATLAMFVEQRLLDTDIRVLFHAWIQRRATGPAPAGGGAVPTVLEGGLEFTTHINEFAVGGALSFADREKTWAFMIGWKGAQLTATVKYIGTGDDRHQVLAVRMGGMTLGSIVEYFVGLANPNANFRLAPPWDFLNGIDLDRFELQLDRRNSTIRLTYDVHVDAGFAAVRKVGIVYDRAQGQGSVRLLVEGQVLGQDYAGADALEWDAVKDDPPALPGKGQALFDLRYFGIGQRIALAQPEVRFTSIAESVNLLGRNMAEPTEPASGLPVSDTSGIRFDASRQWLFGLDCTIMDTVALKLILRDPDLYGIQVGLGGARAGSLAGLSFDLYYRKVTAEVGVFHAQLQVPDAFRQLQLGAASFTLGTIAVDVFTNGNFKVDLGFPHNRDFSNSFALEITYFNGQGGIYLGLLDGATSDRIPRITNGTFSPVLELGVGLSIGAGRTFRKGPLNATLTLNVVGILEGVLGWFNPTDRSQAPALYYWARGTVGIVGTLQGKVDFSVVSVLVTLEIGAYATLTLEAFAPTNVTVEVEARAEASVKVWFVRLHFTYDIKLSASFELASGGQAPWRLAAGQSDRTRLRLMSDAHVPARRRGETLAAIGRATVARGGAARNGVVDADGGWWLDFDIDRGVFPDGAQHAVKMMITPALTVADVPIEWGAAPLANASDEEGRAFFAALGDAQPKRRVVFLLTAETAVPPDARTLADTHLQSVAASAQANTPEETPFAVLSEAVFRWVLAAAGYLAENVEDPAPLVPLGALIEIVEQLALPQAIAQGFSLYSIDRFLSHNLHLFVGAAPPEESLNQSVVPFALPPQLVWTWHDPAHEAEGAHTRDFSTFRPIDQAYQDAVRHYFDRLDPREASARAADRRPRSDNGPVETFASMVFRDYFLLLAKATTQALRDHLAAYPISFTKEDTLRKVALRFPRQPAAWTGVEGATFETIAAHFGISVSELRALNPHLAVPAAGERVMLELGMSVQAVAESAAGWPVTPGKEVALPDFVAEVRAGDTLASLAARFNITDTKPWFESALATTPHLLRPGAAIAMSEFTYPEPLELEPRTAAAALYVRLGHRPEAHLTERVAWYAGAIVALNPKMTDLAAEESILVPRHFDDLEKPEFWPVLAGDTIEGIAAALCFTYDRVHGSAFDAWHLEFYQLNSAGTYSVLPRDTVAVVAPGDTLATLAERLLLDRVSAAFRGLVSSGDILQPLAAVPVRGAKFITTEGTLLDNAQSAGLPLEAFALCAEKIEGLLEVRTDRTLHLHDVPVLDLETLVGRLHQPSVAASVAGQISRFMLHGLRLPAPPDGDNAAGEMTALFDLIGQQIAGPEPSEGGPDAIRLNLKVSSNLELPWLTFAVNRVLGEGERIDTFEAGIDGSATALNKGLASSARADGTLPPGMIVTTDLAGAIELKLREEHLRAYPATTLRPLLAGPGLRALPAYRELPVRYPVTHMIRWRAVNPPRFAVTPPALAHPSLWLLSDDLRATARDGATGYGFDLLQAGANASVPAVPVASWSWATAIDVVVQRIPGAADTLELIGADPDDRQRLAQLLVHLGQIETDEGGIKPSSDMPILDLAWSLSPGAGMTNGLTSEAFDRDASFLIKANLSTETRSGRTEAIADAAEARDHFASLASDQVAHFLTLVWECSVVGGGGYWLRLERPGGAALLPEAAFDQHGRATLTLIVQLDSQTKAKDADRTLHSFSNAAIVGDAVDPGSAMLYAVADAAGPTQRQATLGPGEVGFGLDLKRPDEERAASADDRTRQLYSITGYSLVEDAQGREGQPLAPQLARADDGTPDSDRWSMIRTIPIHRFRRSKLPDVPGFPPAASDPYAGIARDAEPAEIAIWFNDLFGNRTAAGAQHTLRLPLRYRDPLAGPGSWPATTLTYEVLGGAGDPARLVARATFQPADLQPSAGQAAQGVAAFAGRQAEQFGQLWYQVAQPEIKATLHTTLMVAADGKPQPLATGIAPLRNYLAASYLYARACAAGTDVRVPATSGAPCTPASLRTRFGTDADALASANAGVRVEDIFQQATVQVPEFAVADGKSTMRALAPAGCDPEVMIADPSNLALPLREKAVLATDKRWVPIPVPGAADAPVPSLAQLLDGFHTTLEDLAKHNANVVVFAAGARLNYNDFIVTIPLSGDDSIPTLEQVRAAFVAKKASPTLLQILQANADVPGILRAGASLATCCYRVGTGETLASIAASIRQPELHKRNIDTAGMFAPGAPILLRVRSIAGAGRTLERLAFEHGVPATDIFLFNADAPLRDGGAALPGRAAWPADLRLPCTIRAGDTLAAIASRTSAPDALSIVRLNARLPGILRAGLSLSLGGVETQVEADESFEAFAARAGGTIDALAAKIAYDSSTLTAGALIIVPPARTPAMGDWTPAAIAEPWGVNPASWMAANAAMPGLLLAGATIRAEVGDAIETVAPDDSFAALLGRFKARGIDVTVEALLRANASVGFIRADALYLIPPADALLEAELGTGAVLPDRAIFPVRAALRIERPIDLCAANAPEGPDPIATVETPLSPLRLAADPDAAEQGTASLRPFIARLEKALPNLRIATGRTEAEPATELWALSNAGGGLEMVDVRPRCDVPGLGASQPRSYALRPLDTTLKDRAQVSVRALKPDGTLEEAQPRDYHAIDLDLWATSFLADVERLLAHDMATAAYRVEPDALDAIIDTKRRLAQAIPKGLSPILAGIDCPDDAIAAGRKALRQMLLGSLSDGYAAAALIQFDSEVAAPWDNRATAPRLVGTLEQAAAGGVAVNLTDPKLVLAAGHGYVTSVLTVPELHRQEQIALQLRYPATELEFNRRKRLAIPGSEPDDWYASSDWVGFNDPYVDFDLGTAIVPLPLRVHPQAPTLLDQSTRVPPPDGLADVGRWNYVVRFAHQTAEQDRIALKVTFNSGGAAPSMAANEVDRLFDALACYTEAAAALRSALAGLTQMPTANTPILAAALRSFAELAGAVADAWEVHWAGRESGGAAAFELPRTDMSEQTHSWFVTLQSAHGNWHTLTLVAQSNPGDDDWPEIECRLDDRTTLLAPGEIASDTRIYSFPEPVAAHVALEWCFTFGNLRVTQVRDATAGFAVDRNSKLIESAKAETAAGFVYRTPFVAFAAPVRPEQVVEKRLMLDSWAQRPLVGLFTGLLGSLDTRRTVAFAASYGFALSAGDAPIETMIPVLLLPATVVTPELPEQIRTALDAWLEANCPARARAFWRFSVTLFSDSETGKPQPLVELRDVRSALSGQGDAPVIRDLRYQDGALEVQWASVPGAERFEAVFDRPDAPGQPPVPGVVVQDGDGWRAQGVGSFADGDCWRARVRGVSGAGAGPWSADDDAARLTIANLSPPDATVLIDAETHALTIEVGTADPRDMTELAVTDASGSACAHQLFAGARITLDIATIAAPVRIRLRSVRDRSSGHWVETPLLPTTGVQAPPDVTAVIEGEQVRISFSRSDAATAYEAEILDAAGSSLSPPLVIRGQGSPLTLDAARLPEGDSWQVRVRALLASSEPEQSA